MRLSLSFFSLLALATLSACDGRLYVATSDGGPQPLDAELVPDAGYDWPRTPGTMPMPVDADAGAPHATTPRDDGARDAGTRDAGAPHTTTPPAPAPPACAHHTLLHYGLHPRASDALRCIGVHASQISQTIGTAPASAGFHLRDGYASGAPYCAATDLSVRGLTHAEIRTLLSHLASYGFAAWYRWPGHDGWPSADAAHIHAVYSGVPMKTQLEAQVGDWLHGRNGLASHALYTFWTPSATQKDLVRALYAHRH